MARRIGFPLYGVRYCGNLKKKEVHDLDNEATKCQIDKIIRSEYVILFDTLASAHQVGYDNCRHCLDNPPPEVI